MASRRTFMTSKTDLKVLMSAIRIVLRVSGYSWFQILNLRYSNSAVGSSASRVGAGNLRVGSSANALEPCSVSFESPSVQRGSSVGIWAGDAVVSEGPSLRPRSPGLVSARIRPFTGDIRGLGLTGRGSSCLICRRSARRRYFGRDKLTLPSRIALRTRSAEGRTAGVTCKRFSRSIRTASGNRRDANAVTNAGLDLNLE